MLPTSYPFRDGDVDGLAAAGARSTIIDKQVGAENLAAVVIEPIQGEGGFIVPAPGFLPALGGLVPRTTASSSSPTRCRPDSPAPARCSRATTKDVVPDLIVTAKGIAGGLPLSAVTGRAEIMDAAARRRAGRHLRRQPARVRGRARRDRDHRGRRPARPGPRDRAGHGRAAHRNAGRRSAYRRRPRPRRDDRRRAGPARHRPNPTPT